MTIPNKEQLEAAHKEVLSEGPMAPNTAKIVVLCMREPLTRAICDGIAKTARVDLSVVLGAFTSGFNLGIRAGVLAAQEEKAHAANH